MFGWAKVARFAPSVALKSMAEDASEPDRRFLEEGGHGRGAAGGRGWGAAGCRRGGGGDAGDPDRRFLEEGVHERGAAEVMSLFSEVFRQGSSGVVLEYRLYG